MYTRPLFVLLGAINRDNEIENYFNSVATQQVVNFFLLQHFEFIKEAIPETTEEKTSFAKNYLSLTCPCQGIATF